MALLGSLVMLFLSLTGTLATDPMGACKSSPRRVIGPSCKARRELTAASSGPHELTEAELQRRQAYTVATVGLALFNDVLLLLMLVPMLPQLLEPPASELRIACLFSAKDALQLLAAPLAGALTLRVGAHATLSLSLVGLALSTVAFAEARGFPALLLARAVQGATSAALMSGGLTLIAQTHQPEQRGAAIARAHSGLGLGAALGPVLGGMLYEAFGRRATFYAAAALVVLNALWHTLQALWRPAPLLSAPSEAQSAEPPRVQLRQLLRTRDVAIAASGILAVYAAGGLYDACFGLHLAERFGFGAARTSLTFAVEPLSYLVLMACLSPLASGHHPYWSKSRLSALGLALTGLSLPLLTLGGRMSGVLASTVVHGAGYACKDVVGHGLLADLVDEHRVGTYAMTFALADVADSAGYILGPMVGLALCRALRSRTAALFLFGVACAALAPAFLTIRLRSFEQNGVQPSDGS